MKRNTLTKLKVQEETTTFKENLDGIIRNGA